MARSIEQLPDMVSVLAHHSAAVPDRAAYVFLPRGTGPGISLSYRELDRRSGRLAAALAAAGAGGRPVLLILPPGLDFIVAFFAVLKAGAIAVPLNFARQSHHQRRLAVVLEDSGSRLILTNGALLEHLREGLGPRTAAGGIRLLTIEEADGVEPVGLPPVRPEAIAFIQYTSGSTGDPKGVMVSHANLMANERVIRRICGPIPTAMYGGWLPHYHDMGLVGTLLQPLFAGGTYVFMPPLAFVQRPSRWLRMLGEYRIECSVAPNFAYDVCSERCRDEELQGIDLSHWRVALNGAEPIRDHSLRLFAERFAPFGFRPESFLPCYGMAEATLLVSGRQAGAGASRLVVDRDALEQRRQVREVDAGPAREGLVGCGEVAPGHEVVIVDPQTLREAGAGRIGEIWVGGPSVAGGYWRNPRASATVFGAHTADGRGPYLRTGDLGFLHAGQLYVTGRIKDVVIVRGRTLYPQDIEYTVSAASPQLGMNTAAVFAVDDGRREAVVAVQELPRRFEGEPGPLKAAILEAVSREHDIMLGDIRFIPHNGLPRTTSGKIQRSCCKSLYLGNQLKEYTPEDMIDVY